MIAAPSRIAAAAADLLARRIDRRGLLTRVAVVGSAVAVSGTDYVLRPTSAYASICGDEASCGAAWTAMCCTINDGVNACPPGSFAGGWWKSVGANLCGGRARYYVDCQAECTSCGCAPGTHYCAERCWNCRPHCADNGTCDERRVCNNVFRYGQCGRDRHCSGPVLCRAISCTPPWKWADCSRTAATDQATVTHSAPCLPRWTAIQRRYTELGSQGSVLGATMHREIATRRGRIQRYEFGRMYWSPRTGAHYLTGEILTGYLRLGQTGSPMGLPVEDSHHLFERPGHAAHFERGVILQAAGAPARGLWGPIWSRWQAIGPGHDGLGVPLTDVETAPDGVGLFVHFETGSILQGPGMTAYVVNGPAAEKYGALGYQESSLGYPTSDVLGYVDQSGGSAYQVTFQFGMIVGFTSGAPFAVFGPIYSAWQEQGGIHGALGYPTSDVVDVDGSHQRCTFEHGTIDYDATTGTVTTTPA